MDDGTPAGIAGVAATHLLDATFWHARSGMSICDLNGSVLAANAALARFFGRSLEGLTTTSLRDLTLAQDRPACDAALRLLAEGASAEIRVAQRYVTAAGEVVGGLLTAVALRDDRGDVTRLIARIEDLRGSLIASLDPLTGLVTRQVFQERLRSTLADRPGEDDRTALLVVNLDRFDQVNAGLGQAAADLILIEVARRLVAVSGSQERVGRLGGDEFGILVPGMTSTDEAAALAVEIRRSLGEAHWVIDNPVVVSARVGVVAAPGDGGDAETLTRRATGASQRAKQLSSGWATHADAAADSASHDAFGLVADLRAAIAHHDLTVAYQPIVDPGGRTHCVEALARWEHRYRGAVPPEQFIAVAEQNTLIAALTQHILTLAIQQAARWTSTLGPIPVSVNLSGRLLHDPASLDAAAAVITSAGIPPELITLEITETALADGGNPTIVAALQALRDSGVRVSIDDFGTGYSSLSYLRHLPVDELKIDRSFVKSLDADPRTARIIRSVVDLAHSLDLVVVAEGVEEEHVASHLLRLGVDYLQGYFIATPAPGGMVSGWLDAHRPLNPAKSPQGGGGRTLNVLVVASHPAVQAALRERLHQRNHHVTQARDSRAALDGLDRRVPDLVILNQPTPGPGDLETSPRLRAAGYTGPIVLFSGSSPEDVAAIRFPLDVWPVSAADDETLLRLVDGLAEQPASATSS